MAIRIERVSSATFEELLYIWNQGFQGYAMDMTFTMDRLVGRFGLDGLSPQFSVILYVDDKPAGFVLNGIRVVGNRKIAWNGGTGVAPEFRGQGLGKQLIGTSLAIYREEGVETAYLEAIASNAPAIALYGRMGYEMIDKVTFLNHKGHLQDAGWDDINRGTKGFVAQRGIPAHVKTISFYQAFAPWQAQWQNIRDGESVILKTNEGEVLGYALFKRNLDDAGQISAISLYQCEVKPGLGVRDRDDVVKKLLCEAFGPLETDCQRVTINLSTSNETVIDTLTEARFTTLSEQVMMQHTLEG